MKKADAEKRIRWLISKWRHEHWEKQFPNTEPSFVSFYSWVADIDPQSLDFRSSISVNYDVELWFDDETGQSWSR